MVAKTGPSDQTGIMSPSIHPSAAIEKGASLADDVAIGPFCHVSAEAVLEAGVRLLSHVSVRGKAHVGAGCVLYPNVVLGGEPQSLGFGNDGASRLEIGAGTVLREGVTVSAGIPAHGGLTRVGPRSYMMAGVHIGHDAHIGEACVFANLVTIAGHCRIGNQVWMGGIAGLHQFTHVGDHAFIAAGSVVTSDVVPFAMASGNHARLVGLNVVGLRRRGFDKPEIHAIRAAYRDLFEGGGRFKDRLEAAKGAYSGSPHAATLIAFADSPRDGRRLCSAGV